MKLSKMLLAKFLDLFADDSDQNLIFITAAGMIEGKAITEKDLKDPQTNIAAITSLCQNITSDYKNMMQLSDEDRLPDNDGYFILKDVSLTTSVKTINMPFTVIFFKDIIGFSVGNFEPMR